MPATISAPYYKKEKSKIIIPVILGVAILIGIVAGIVTIRGNSATEQQDTQMPGANIPTQIQSPTATSTEGIKISIPTQRPTVYAPVREPTIDPTWLACPQPIGWEIYKVKPSDTLERIGLLYGISVDLLISNNCMGSRDSVRLGERLYVPGPTATPTNTPSPTPTRTNTPRRSSPVPSTITPGPTGPRNTPVSPTNTSAPPTNTPEPVIPTSTDIPTPTPPPV